MRRVYALAALLAARTAYMAYAQSIEQSAKEAVCGLTQNVLDPLIAWVYMGITVVLTGLAAATFIMAVISGSIREALTSRWVAAAVAAWGVPFLLDLLANIQAISNFVKYLDTFVDLPLVGENDQFTC